MLRITCKQEKIVLWVQWKVHTFSSDPNNPEIAETCNAVGNVESAKSVMGPGLTH